MMTRVRTSAKTASASNPASDCVIVSEGIINQGASGLCVVVPLTSRDKGIPLHLATAPPPFPVGRGSPQTADLVDDRLKALLKLR